MSGAVFPLNPQQLQAVHPERSVWLSASAGTGKTQVLSARVLRLLLQRDIHPSQILCLTFTKAGAAEMAIRINSVLARWVRIDDVSLGKELLNIGAPNDPETRGRARTLFASVLDCPGGGLRINTIHAFSQWLLANFPTEAGLMPGMRPMEDRERAILQREVLADLLQQAERGGNELLLEQIAEFSRQKGPDALMDWVMRCARAHGLWFGRLAWQPPMRPRVLQLLGLPSDADQAWVDDVLSPDIFPDLQLQAMLPLLEAWKAKGGQESAALIRQWLSLDVQARSAAVPEFYKTILKADGTPRSMPTPCKQDPSFLARQEKVAEALSLYTERTALFGLAEFLAPALEIGRVFALKWDEAKRREGLLDFDDLIERAASLLKEKDAADWIRFKLDRRFDHVLVDEAQDTNEAQWRIIDSVIDDFFSGEGAAGEKIRTIFTVGDYKQAIFGFQGTSPENFGKARERVRRAMRHAHQNAVEGRLGNQRQADLDDLDLGQSFRTASSVLEFVDRTIEALGWRSLGLDRPAARHIGQDRPGLVRMWSIIRDGRGEIEESEGQENWLARHDRMMADKIAEQVSRWTSGIEPYPLVKGTRRNAGPGDIMVLVRSRKELAGLIVARLHAKGVPVAGVDRLRLGEPLVVKDLMSALRFAAQPFDDLELANLLSSPLIGWSQEDLLTHLPRKKGKRLWEHLRRGTGPLVAQTVEKLRQLLSRADFETPQAMLQWILVGPWRSREQLVSRLGHEANDPIDELLNAAFAYEAAHTPSLAGFIRWFDAGEGELKRDPDEATGLVRVMTVHGSKGLQSPIVILADAASKPGAPRELELTPERVGAEADTGSAVPLTSVRKEERAGRVADAYAVAEESELKEHWRLLYVAMTRAEEALFIGGSLPPRERSPHQDSWYARLEQLFDEDAQHDEIWGRRKDWGAAAGVEPVQQPQIDHAVLKEPDWLRTPIGPEPRPPRPLAPSSAGDDQGADPPIAGLDLENAARRGVLVHGLLERLPDIASEMREDAAAAWLARHGAEFTIEEQDEIARRVLAVLDHPEFAEVFGPESLAEVPLAAVVNGQVIAGFADRLLVTSKSVTVVDFKSARRPPTSLEGITSSTLSQMAAYVAALEVIYPGREVKAAVLYTQTAQLFELPPRVIELHKKRF